MQLVRSCGKAIRSAGRRLRMRNIVIAAIAPVSVAAILAGTAPLAEASSNSYIYTQSGRPSAIALCNQACGSIGHPIYPANGTIAHMLCWEDLGWYDGNYNTNRWFIVTVNGQPGEWFINSSYVYYQTSVPHC